MNIKKEAEKLYGLLQLENRVVGVKFVYTKEDYDAFVSTLIENGFTRSVDRSEYDDSCYFQATTEDRCMGADVSFYDTSTYRDKTSMSATVGFTQYGLGYQAGLRQSQQ